MGPDLLAQALWPARLQVLAADRNGDREARRHIESEFRAHLGESRSLAPEQMPEVTRGGAVIVIEGVDVGHRNLQVVIGMTL